MQFVRRYVSPGRSRARGLVKSQLLKLAPKITCERCGAPLFTVFPAIANGRLYLFGAEESSVHVEWSSKRTLRFRHEALDRCVPEPGVTLIPRESLGDPDANG